VDGDAGDQNNLKVNDNNAEMTPSATVVSHAVQSSASSVDSPEGATHSISSLKRSVLSRYGEFSAESKMGVRRVASKDRRSLTVSERAPDEKHVVEGRSSPLLKKRVSVDDVVDDDTRMLVRHKKLPKLNPTIPDGEDTPDEESCSSPLLKKRVSVDDVVDDNTRTLIRHKKRSKLSPTNTDGVDNPDEEGCSSPFSEYADDDGRDNFNEIMKSQWMDLERKTHLSSKFTLQPPDSGFAEHQTLYLRWLSKTCSMSMYLLALAFDDVRLVFGALCLPGSTKQSAEVSNILPDLIASAERIFCRLVAHYDGRLLEPQYVFYFLSTFVAALIMKPCFSCVCESVIKLK
jgi:hypothetical protein